MPLTNQSDSAVRLRAILFDGCEQLGLMLSETQIEQLIHYTQALEKWNKTYNLTAIRDVELMVKRHVVDALSVVESIGKYSPKTLADIGTGGGIPGVVLAVVFPELQVYLVESVGKKCRFLRHVVAVLGLSSRVHVMQQRVENWQPDAPLSIVICRAFTSLENFTAMTRHLGNGETLWLAMKAANIADEVNRLPSDFNIVDNEQLNVPLESAERHLLVMKKRNVEKTIENHCNK